MYVCMCDYLKVSEAVPARLLVGQGEQTMLQISPVLVLLLLSQVRSGQKRAGRRILSKRH
jgi:hypothetical protein